MDEAASPVLVSVVMISIVAVLLMMVVLVLVTIVLCRRSSNRHERYIAYHYCTGTQLPVRSYGIC